MTVWRQRLLRAWLAICAVAPVILGVEATHGQGVAPSPAGPPVVPVSAAPVTRKDVPIYLNGLGTVQALQTVQLRSQVDGVLLSVPVTEGQDVKKSDVLAVIDPRPYQAALEAAIAHKQQDEAQLVAAKADVVRYTALAARQDASQQQLEVAQAKAGQLMASIAMDQAQIDTAKLNLSWCTLTAPFDGRVGLRMVDPGNFIRSAEVSAVIPVAQIRPIAVIFTLPQDNLPAIQRALAAGRPPVAALNGNDKTELDQGSLLTVDNMIDASTGTVKLKAILPNKDYRLWPGQFVSARLLVGTSSNVLTLPSAAVRHGQGDLFVYAVNPDQTVSRKVVEIARDDGTTSIVSKGLDEGQLVVIEGQSRLQDGARISILNGTAKQAANSPNQGG
jgi:membrane fusion protein, multidrug efflux system